ncbi:hypothetical protein Q5762_06385 [Streptomyces sp. P9(2023)]|uniref:hypothetical protein n=1 Tax=Streptomyces sp. P9(2023) TaxID=3064394 RepID=UPI0028F460BB|nr:hypothetical protein [Streptomyces sp. P9(2023)]MDT9687986.1 hypothetical protein [Streptomyces sp. P9(2023)]
MAGQGRGAGRRAAACLLTALLALAGCAAPEPADPAPQEIRTLLDRHARALLARDEAAYAVALDPALAPTAIEEFDRLAEVPLASWDYRLKDVDRAGQDGAGQDRATVRAELSYRISGYDSGPVTTERVLDLTERDGRWYVTGDRPAEGATQQLWQQGDVETVRGERSLVLGVGQSEERLKAIAATADRAVPAVSAAWPGKWARRVVVLVPASLDAMGGLLGAPPSSYRGIAAVTTGEVGGGPDAPADRVIVNPEAYGVLGDFGRQVVLTHETTHVATRAATSAATPVWLSEGFADWVAYRDTGRTAAQAAPELRRAVRAGELPAALPDDKAFAFGGDAEALARAYEGGWLACDLIAERWGEPELREFYRAVGGHPQREGAVEKALGEVLGTTPEAFTTDWRAFLRERLG